MEKKIYNIPVVEVLYFKAQRLMRAGSELPDDPGSGGSSAPVRRTEVF